MAPQGSHATRIALVDGPTGREPTRTASPRGGVSTVREGFQAILRLGPWIVRVAEISGRARRRSRERLTGGAPEMRRRRGSRRTARLTARRAEAVRSFRLLQRRSWASNPGAPRRGARRNASEAGRRPSLSADKAARKQRCPASPARRSPGSGRAWLLGRPRGHPESSLKLEARRQSRLHSIMLSAKVSARPAAWKPRSFAKAERAVIREPSDRAGYSEM